MTKRTKIFLTAFAFFVILFVYFHNLYAFVFISGHSMEPTLKHKSVAFFEKKINQLETGDIIIFHHEGKSYIKRITGIPGEEYLILDTSGINKMDELSVTYTMFPKDTLKFSSKDDLSPMIEIKTIPENFYFVEGDNFKNSEDSKIFGLISREQIFGKYMKVF